MDTPNGQPTFHGKENLLIDLVGLDGAGDEQQREERRHGHRHAGAERHQHGLDQLHLMNARRDRLGGNLSRVGELAQP